MVKVTHAAISAITKEAQDIIDEGRKPLIRFSMAVGWGGPQLRLTLEESALENDEITEQDGISFLINERDQVYFNAAKIDYVKTLFGGGQFTVLRV